MPEASVAHRKRVIFVDQARALAIAMMLVGHSLHRFLGEPWRLGEAYRNYTFVRGLSSALFLTIAGFSFVVASMGHLEEYTRYSPKLARRLRRIGIIFLLGTVLQLPASSLYGIVLHTSEAGMRRLIAFNVLQNIAFGLLLLHGILFFAKTVRRFAIAALIAGVVILASAPLVYHPAVDAQLPQWLQGALNLAHGARFPIVPFTAFICLGAVFGALFLRYRDTPLEARVFVAVSGVGLALIGFEQVIRHLVPGGVFPYSSSPSIAHGPGNTFARGGFALLIIAALFFVSRYHVFLPRLSKLMSRCSLAVYVIHLVLVYGGAQLPGLFSSHRESLSPPLVACWIAFLLGAMIGMAKLLVYLDTFHRSKYRLVQHALLLAFALSFLLLPRVPPLGFGIVFISAAVVLDTIRNRPERLNRLKALLPRVLRIGPAGPLR